MRCTTEPCGVLRRAKYTPAATGRPSVPRPSQVTERVPMGASPRIRVATRRPVASNTERSTLAAEGNANSICVADYDGFGCGADSAIPTMRVGVTSVGFRVLIRNARRV